MKKRKKGDTERKKKGKKPDVEDKRIKREGKRDTERGSEGANKRKYQ